MPQVNSVFFFFYFQFGLLAFAKMVEGKEGFFIILSLYFFHDGIFLCLSRLSCSVGDGAIIRNCLRRVCG